MCVRECLCACRSLCMNVHTYICMYILCTVSMNHVYVVSTSILTFSRSSGRVAWRPFLLATSNLLVRIIGHS